MSDNLEKGSALWQDVVRTYKTVARDKQRIQLGIHDLDHIMRVRQNCFLIYQDLPQRDQAKINLSVLLAAAMFHDIGFIKLEGKEKEKGQHIQLSMIMCVEQMNLFGFTEDEIHQTQGIIETHHQKNHSTKTLSQKVLYLADKLDLMGIDGTVRNIIRHAHIHQNRDVLVAILREELLNRVENDLQHLEIASPILRKNYQLTIQFLNSVSLDSLLRTSG